MPLPYVVLGAGGHAKVVVDALVSGGHEVVAVTDSDPSRHGHSVLGVTIAGGDEAVSTIRLGPDGKGEPALAMGLGMPAGAPLAGLARRLDLAAGLEMQGYRFPAVVHPRAIIAADVEVGGGAQIMAGAVVQPGCRVGRMAIVNTRASVDHDCLLGAGCHVAPGAVLGGGVQVGECSLVGMGATVLPGTVIGCGCIIAAGAVVLHDVPDGGTVFGIPAEERRT